MPVMLQPGGALLVAGGIAADPACCCIQHFTCDGLDPDHSHAPTFYDLTVSGFDTDNASYDPTDIAWINSNTFRATRYGTGFPGSPFGWSDDEFHGMIIAGWQMQCVCNGNDSGIYINFAATDVNYNNDNAPDPAAVVCPVTFFPRVMTNSFGYPIEQTLILPLWSSSLGTFSPTITVHIVPIP
jgi:hypothetical protein